MSITIIRSNMKYTIGRIPLSWSIILCLQCLYCSCLPFFFPYFFIFYFSCSLILHRCSEDKNCMCYFISECCNNNSQTRSSFNLFYYRNYMFIISQHTTMLWNICFFPSLKNIFRLLVSVDLQAQQLNVENYELMTSAISIDANARAHITDT